MSTKKGKDNYLVLGGIYGDPRGLDLGCQQALKGTISWKAVPRTPCLGDFFFLFLFGVVMAYLGSTSILREGPKI